PSCPLAAQPANNFQKNSRKKLTNFFRGIPHSISSLFLKKISEKLTTSCHGITILCVGREIKYRFHFSSGNWIHQYQKHFRAYSKKHSAGISTMMVCHVPGVWTIP
ncbi:hypothetical protein, partial [Methanocorpusculum vombati]